MAKAKASKDYNKNYYDAHLARWEESKICNYELSFALTKTKAYANPSQQPVVLDVGCGLGVAKTFVVELFPDARYVGLERDIYPCKEAHILRNAECVIGDACNLCFRDNSMNIILISHVIAHLNEAESAIKEAYRILRPLGIIMIITPNKLFLDLVIKPIEKITGRVYQDKTIVRNLGKSELTGMLEREGYKIMYSSCLRWGLPFDDKLSFIPLIPHFPFWGNDILTIGQKVQR
ncbi:class I SAM-dependent methyltransferase [Chloroflexota bacterium]